MSATSSHSTVMSTKGQVVLPKAVRQSSGWSAGARLIVEEAAEGVFLRLAPIFEPTHLADVVAMLKSDDRVRSLAEMDAAILDQARRAHAGD